MYSEERKLKIIDFITNYSRASVQDLSDYLKVSQSTIRRDLKELQTTNQIQRTHGGAVSLQAVNFEPKIMDKEVEFVQEKKAIAKKAVEFIDDGDTILLDAGTTTLPILEDLQQFSQLTIVTNSILIMRNFKPTAGIEILFLGGSLRNETLASVGSFAEQNLEMIRVDKAFVAINGVHLTEGLTTPNLMEARIKKLMIQNAQQVILLSDSSKMGKVSFAKVADLQEIDKFIVDDRLHPSFKKSLEDLGVEVISVQTPP
ncbi:DeoR/GlpR family DNA-binding transcription regulator [Peribacillus simplex]|uniref:DeoR/GlpR family DNA-binding transcription regulator n=2 Tax=Peribacillus TaxID=2675229 RepID=A0AA90PFM7_9BACI|nr:MULTISPECIES: DeoR/GlpR family DNA-binding transcription regulator [Peribacillus]MDP1420210.1 DeoR/GlpR family DNA-binding transcription regulator [Peribacillus simplex]MDP1453651.1 DeoR/GlpR family DNA-binding transcription regulator [Peribacillus frigoritolerans]